MAAESPRLRGRYVLRKQEEELRHESPPLARAEGVRRHWRANLPESPPLAQGRCLLTCSVATEYVDFQ
ncbi:hypothetical protein GCM10010308_60790 [Streptomyces vinaceusdrappus]|nr:hypothetical protein GCM10010308_60790 [Streptomyces vinaceusdrappus]